MMPGRLVAAVLRCYPARWRSRHGDEAAELAELLIRDGTPARAVALSYLCGAARERLAGRPQPAGGRGPHSRGGLAGCAADAAVRGPGRRGGARQPGAGQQNGHPHGPPGNVR